MSETKHDAGQRSRTLRRQPKTIRSSLRTGGVLQVVPYG